jgi:hypothetical protein
MEKKFRLKKEVCHLFGDGYKRGIKEMHLWNADGIPAQILEEVERLHISYGHKSISFNGLSSSNLSGWTSEGNKAEFHFTVTLNGVSSEEYNDIDPRKLMDDIQYAINAFVSENLE